ncbi:MAG: hypothetical protein AAGA88_00340 [Pseudomonadota bacterium]
MTSDGGRRIAGAPVVIIELAAVAIVLLITADAAVKLWQATPVHLAIGRDGRLAIWLAQQGYLWNSPLSVTTVNPFQGAGSMLLPINAWWIPASWPILMKSPGTNQFILSELIYAAEVLFSVGLLSRVLGLGRISSFLAALMCTALLFPPFNFYFGLQGWIATAPIYAHTIAMFSLMYAVLLLIGRPIAANRSIQATFNVGLVVAFTALLYLLFLAAPFWNAGMLVGAAVGFACVGLSSPSWSTFFWRLGTGVALLVWGLGSGVLEFLLSSQRYSARFLATDIPAGPLIDWSALDRFSWDGLLAQFCANGIGCTSQIIPTPWPMPTAQHLLLWFIAGAVLVAFFALATEFRRLAAVIGAIWVFLLAFWATQAIGLTRTIPIGPLYTYLPLYPLLTVMAIGGPSLLISRLARRQRTPEGIPTRVIFVEAGFGAMVLFIAAISAAELAKTIPHPQASIGQPAVAKLRSEIALAPGDIFRGSVASALGSPGGDMMKSARYDAENPEPDWQIEQYFGRTRSELGTSLALLDIWELGIPSLEEYGQAITPALELYERAFLTSDGQDDSGRYFVFVRAPNLPILESLGVRFVFTDADLAADEASLRSVLPINDDISVRLYELRDPNLGSYSPTELRVADTASEMIAALRETPGMLKRTAMIAGPLDVQLRPAQSSNFRYVRNGAVLEAASSGESAILLPMQYSHCFDVVASGPGSLIAVVRANILHTLVIFSGDVSVHFRWDFGFFGNSGCRTEDVSDLQRLGLDQALREVGHAN